MNQPAARAPRRNRPPRPAAPPLPEMDALDRTHRRILGALGDLSALVERLARGESDAATRAAAQQLCAFFGGEAHQHHADEERIVFPDLVALGDEALTQHVLRLQQDHGWIEEDWFEIEPHLLGVAQGHGGVDIELLRQMVQVFDTLLREHIALEEGTVYPAARARREKAAEVAARRAAPDRH